jgi:uncharacterized protein YjbJ (UPF0337 family)
MPQRSNSGPLAERIKGKAKEAIGTVLGDDALRHEGELHRVKADALTDAAELAASADLDAYEAELARRAEALDAEQRSLVTETAAAATAERIDHELERKEVEADLQRRTEERAAEVAADATASAADRREALGGQRAVAARQEALRLQSEADAASVQAAALDTAAQTIEES